MLASVGIGIGIGTSYASSTTDSFREFCLEETSNNIKDTADFVCEIDIFQMKEDIETIKKFNSEIVRNSYSLKLFPNSDRVYIVACNSDEFITNVGYTGTDVGKNKHSGFEINVHTSYQLNDSKWVLAFANQSDEEIPIQIKYSCLK